MAHESFEDETVAAILNHHFVAIKVDREERPDIDHIYMTFCQAMQGEGGWPLTIIMTPDGHPFFAGTYFPKTPRYGRPGLIQILQEIARLWQTNRARLEEASRTMAKRMEPLFAGQAGEARGRDAADQAFQALEAAYDPVCGGFGPAPKFPTFHRVQFLLRYARLRPSERAATMALSTLRAIMRGGIVDHVGGGMARYSTDDCWRVPHFEKMLYDNALALAAYAEAYAHAKDPVFLRFVRNMVSFFDREMRAPEGLYYSAVDADSAGGEGRFYLWRPEDVIAALGREDGELYNAFYDITEAGNFEGANVPNAIGQDPAAFAASRGMTEEELWHKLDALNEKLRAVRDLRERPAIDDKCLTSWNALMAFGLAKAGTAFGEPTWVARARELVAAIERVLVRPDDGRLLARYRDGEAGIFAFADDHAYLVAAHLELYRATLDSAYLERARHWQAVQDTLFWDKAHGGYAFYGRDAESLIAVPKPAYDGAMPSANSQAAHNLWTLYALSGDSAYADRLDSLFRAFGGDMATAPLDCLWLVTAAMMSEVGSTEVVLAGPREDALQRAQELCAMPLPEVVWLMADARGEEAPYAMGPGGKPQYYVCRGFRCDRPETDWEVVVERLSNPPSWK
ncbi:hypothetical protein SAMN05421799_102217 [Alicyclobacillus vulcanalis]|uniref:Spermatogenesis-associated protein 20-like TRX domain-containing protein n=1 Tax=Alicyclobacillus vulcanalis TaxID=252246 RepID=A0A1N7KVR4_9BACL|nr:hypothetical protein SAMN05421799_102217 [Alicyclobacillus vulcanalis]